MERVSYLAILLTCFCLRIHGQVSSPYYLYDKKRIQLDDRSFKRYLIPQLKTMTKEFYYILKKLHPIHESNIQLYFQVTNIERKFKVFNKECTGLNDECILQLKTLYNETRVLDKMILSPLHKQLSLSQDLSPSELEAFINLIGALEKISNYNYRLMHALEEYILTINTTFFLFFDGKSSIQPLIHEILLSTELMMTQLLKGKMKEDFHAIWIHFFKEIDQKLIYEKDKVYLLKRLEELNLSWNTFHMKMTKGNYNLPKNITSHIKTMHNRWNSCLKIVLR